MLCLPVYTFAEDLKERYSYKKITALVLLVSFMAHVFSSALIMADYHLNTARYARYCVNKARPQLHCKGKCQVLKKIQAEENRAGQNTERKQEVNNELVFSLGAFCQVPENIAIIQTALNIRPGNQELVDKGCLFPIFHPPQRIV